MSGCHLLQRVCQPPYAAPEREQDQGCVLRQIENPRERREREIHVRPFADGLFNDVAKLRVFRGQEEIVATKRLPCGSPRADREGARIRRSGDPEKASRVPSPPHRLDARQPLTPTRRRTPARAAVQGRGEAT